MDVCEKKKRKLHPRERANFLSRITFFYTSGIFWRTYKEGTLEQNDLYDVLENCQAENLDASLEKHMKNDHAKHGAISIYRILWSCYGIEYLSIGIVQLIIRTLVIITIPMTLSKVVLYFQPGQTELTKKEAILLGTLLILLNLMNVTYIHNYLLRLSEFGIRVRTAFCSAMYRKCLRLTPSCLSEITVGKIVTLMTKDVTTFESIIFYGNDTWIGITQGILVCCLIYYRIGSASFFTIGFFILVIPVQVYIGIIVSKLKKYSCNKTDERLQTTKETFTAIQTIKMYAWEEYFENQICGARKKEITSILKIFLVNTASLLLGTLTSKIAFYLLLMTCIWFGENLSAELIYYLMTLFLRIRHALTVAIPKGVVVTGELVAAIDRIESLLNANEIQEQRENRKIYQEEPRILLTDLTIATDREVILENTTLCIGSGLTVITGPVGCGKTSLLKVLLGEHPVRDGKVNIIGSISYASQDPWIFPSSLKQNIVFGETFDSSRYEKVLEVCALNFDIDQFEFGDDIIVSDKGTNLSKGQKARVNLARAVYKRADIYLLDDCLTSVDAAVRRFIFENCIKGFLKDKTCIFVTQRLENLSKDDKILFIQNGTIDVNHEIAAKDGIDFFPNDISAISKCEGINNNIVEEIEENQQETTKLLQQYTRYNNIYREENSSGRVIWSVYGEYIKYGGGYIIFFFIILFFISNQFSKSYTEKVLSNWVDEMNEEVTPRILTKTSVSSASSISMVYSILTLATIIVSVVTSWAFFSFTKKASLGLHNSMTNSVINATMKFFDGNLIGNILNRFSKDLSVIDEQFPSIVFEFLEISFGYVGIVVLIATVNVVFLAPMLIISLILFLLRTFYVPTGRSLQRLDLSTRSPVIGYLNASLEGLPTIRAFSAQPILSMEFNRHQDLYTSATYTSKCCQRAFGYALDICCTVFVAVIIAVFLAVDTGSSVGDIGLGITQAFTLSGVVQYGIRQWAELETKITSVERVMEYTRTEREQKDGEIPGTDWPIDCSIDYKNVRLTYAYGKLWTLKDINLSIHDQEKIGIVGRTGAGKSSIISTLFRLYSYEGQITIGKADIQTIPLTFYRSKIAIIPQEPLLFTGTIRANIDPFHRHEDEDIWRAIEKVKLKHLVPTLTTAVVASGDNFSAGQKQLMCLARALVSRSKIIVMDEATSDMDRESDAVISEVIKENFQACTVVIIAHKLQSVLGCDRVMVVQSGKIVEFDSPKVLARDENGHFRKLLEKAGIENIFEEKT
ncbi:unnamed protein product [Phaedon cochleariae]|uniref:Uncharacterized protein n=1 Tax=Phaedon cochleariae TaxID=80249 RepID=A0A9N9SMG9_PHACE|nr:unnamed protein product [Phaedon cochleariae]